MVNLFLILIFKRCSLNLNSYFVFVLWTAWCCYDHQISTATTAVGYHQTNADTAVFYSVLDGLSWALFPTNCPSLFQRHTFCCAFCVNLSYSLLRFALCVKKINLNALSGNRALMSSVITSPAALNSCSDGTLLGGGPKYTRARLAKSGSHSLFSLSTRIR